MDLFVYIKSLFAKGEDRTSKLKRNIAWSYVIKIGVMLVELIKVPILLTYLSPEKYGIWLTIVSMVLWSQQLDLGLGSGLRYKFTESLALNDKRRCKGLITTAYYSLLAIMLCVSVLLIPVILNINWVDFLNVTLVQENELRITILIVLFTFAFQFVLELLTAVLKGDQRSAMSEIFKPIGSVLGLVVVLLLNRFSHDSLLYASMAMALPYVAVLLFANFYFYIKEYREYSPSLRFFSLHYMKDIYSIGLKFFVGQFASLIVFTTANFLLSNQINPSEVSVYSTARTYFGLIMVFMNVIVISTCAPITDAYVRQDMNWIKKSMSVMNKIALIFIGIELIMLLCSKFAICIWTRGKLEVPISLALAFVVYNILALFAQPLNYFLNGIGKLNVNMILSVCKILLFLPVAILLLKLLGSFGLVVATLLINTIPNILLGKIQYNKIITGTAKGIWDK